MGGPKYPKVAGLSDYNTQPLNLIVNIGRL